MKKKTTNNKTTPSKRRAPSKKAKTSKLESLSHAHGKDEAIKRAKELEELVGIKQVNNFGTTIPEVFEENISKMSVAELQELAVKVGVFPNGTRTALKNKLSKAFSEFNRSSMVIPPPKPVNLNKNSATEEALRLMKEGL